MCAWHSIYHIILSAARIFNFNIYIIYIYTLVAVYMLYFHSVSPFASILVCRYSYIKCHKLLWPVVNYLWDSSARRSTWSRKRTKLKKLCRRNFPLDHSWCGETPGSAMLMTDRCFFVSYKSSSDWWNCRNLQEAPWFFMYHPKHGWGALNRCNYCNYYIANIALSDRRSTVI